MRLDRRRRSVVLYAATNVQERVIALTFDDGPSPWTPPILDALAAYSVPATFFVVGDAIPGRENILLRMRAEGHEVGNHSQRHAHLDRLDPSAVREELRTASAAIGAVLGEPPKFFRPPYFAFNDDVLRVAARCGFRDTVCASLFTNDWDATSGAPIAEAILAGAAPGSIVDLHDGRPPHDPPHSEGYSRDDRRATVEAVAVLVPALLDHGYRFVPVSELLAMQRGA